MTRRRTAQSGRRPPARKRPTRAQLRARRIGALVALGLVIGLVWWFSATVSNAYQAALTATPEPKPTGTPVALPDGVEPGAPAAPQAPTRECTANDLVLTAFSDASGYAPGVQPRFWLSLRNNAPTPCVMNIGTAVQLYTVTSGGQTVWDSSHCQSGAVDELVELAAGQELTAPPVTWVRERSAPETCQQQRPAAEAGGTAYQLTVSVGGVSSAPVSFVLE